MIKCINDRKVEVLKSQAGYYIGTTDEYDGPYCRISSYYSNYDDALMALNTKSFSVRDSVEINFCNNGNSCIKE